MKDTILIVLSNERLNGTVYKMVLGGEDILQKEGQFLEMKLPGFTLRRPFSIADSTQNTITVLYKVLGEGTKCMTEIEPGTELPCLISLGRGFDISKSATPVLIGGGIGCAPLYYLAKQFYKTGIRPSVICGFKTAEEIYYKDEFAAICDLIITTDDGSFGFKGNVVDCLNSLEKSFDFYYACGPEVMLKAAQKKIAIRGELSLEARMGCGFGVCMGCSIKTVSGYARVCKEGPVFDSAEVLW